MGRNCGSYALGTKTWYIPAAYYDCDLSDQSKEKEYLEVMVGSILCDFPFLRRVATPRLRGRIIGFRLATGPNNDFHFITRKNGKWMEKMGSCAVERFKGQPTKPWKYSSRVYDSPIAWFVDTRFSK